MDINYELVNGQPEIRLWGLDQNGNRVMAYDRRFQPYFYLLVEEGTKVEEVIQKIHAEKNRFPKIGNLEVQDRRFFGKEVKAIKIICKEPDVLPKYADQMAKIPGVKDHLEDDIRFSMRYIIDNNLSPCSWHEVEVQEAPEQTNLKVERIYEVVDAPRTIEKTGMPPLKIMAFSITCFSERGTPKPKGNPVVLVSTLTKDRERKQFAAADGDDRKVLQAFVEYVGAYDPDIVVGYGNNRFDWPYLMERSKTLGIKLAVDRSGAEPHTSVYGHVSVTGRANLDLLDIAGDIPEVKIKTLENVAEFLGIRKKTERTLIDEVHVPNYWKDLAKREILKKFFGENAESILGICEAMLNFAFQLSSLTGLPLDQVAAAAVGFRVDSYLVKQAHRLGELVPRRLEQPYLLYKGAMVLAPKPGIHENIAVLDFASMYPNLMMLFNISPDTLIRLGEARPSEAAVTIPEVKHEFRTQPHGFYNVVLSNLLSARKEVKQKLKEVDQKSVEYRVLEAREKSLKVVANATYGYAGWVGARWYVREVAESTAALGRDTIKKVIEMAEKKGLEIIYSDTDAIFVKYDLQKIEDLLAWVEKELKMEIKVDKLYSRILFTEAKKRYAGLLTDGTLDIVGLEVVRGDWSEAARIVQEKVLEIVLKGNPPKKAVEYVRRYISELKVGKIPLDELIVWKTLTKPVEEYEVRAPHVEVAKILLKEGWDLTLGDKVGYVITKGGGKLFQKAKPHSMAKPEDLDIEYYLNNQILPAALRILKMFGVTEQQVMQAEKFPSLTEYVK